MYIYISPHGGQSPPSSPSLADQASKSLAKRRARRLLMVLTTRDITLLAIDSITWGFGFRVSGFGFWVSGRRFGVWGFGVWDWGLGVGG